MRRYLRILVPIVLALLCSGPLKAQLDNTMYFMHGVPQSNRLNPAFQPRENVYVGFPLITPLRVEVRSSALAWENVIYSNPENPDSLITFLHPQGNKQQFLDNLKPLNLVTEGFATSIIGFGFRTSAGYFSLDMNIREEGTLFYPRDLFRLFIEGTDVGEQYRFDGMGVNATAFDEVAIGWSYDLADNLRIGARVKMLFGIADMGTYKSRLGLDIADNRDWILSADMRFRASLSMADVVYDVDGMVDDVVIDDMDNYKLKDYAAYFFNFTNFGLGADLGVEYWPIDQLKLSASVVDLGYIRWKDEVNFASYSTMDAGEDGSYRFEGIEINPLEISDDNSFGDVLDSSLNVILDSLGGFLQFSEGGAYSKMLNAKLYAGASFYLTPNINFGLLSRTDFLGEKIQEQVTASVNLSTGRFLNFSLSYSYMNSYFKNIGAGISTHMGPINFYLVSDNVLNALFWPEEARSVNLWFGLNLMFGYREKIDLPLVQ